MSGSSWPELWQRVRPLLELKGDGKTDGNGWVWARCIDAANHKSGDEHFSMRINVQSGGVKCMSRVCPVGPNLNQLARRLGLDAAPRGGPISEAEAMSRLAQERLLSEETLRDTYGVHPLKGGWAFPVDDPEGNGQPHVKRFSWWPGEPRFWWPKDSGVVATDLVYGLSYVEQGTESVYLAAGEIDCLTLLEAGYDAVSFLAGENAQPSAKAVRKLLDRGIQNLWIVYDNDEAGREGREKVAARCAGAGLNVQLVNLPEDLGDGGDVNDLWRRCEGDHERFIEALSACPSVPLVDQQRGEERSAGSSPASSPEQPTVVTPFRDFLAKDWGAGEPVVDGWLSTGDIAWLYGQVGHGKTLEACEFALSVGTGRPLFGRFRTVQGPVLIVEEDCHPQKLQRYLATLAGAYGIEDAQVFVWERQFLRLDDDTQANLFMGEVRRLQPRLIILDAFLDLHEGDGFTGRELRPILDRIAALPQLLPCAVLVLDHTRKEDNTRKSIPDPIDALYGGRAKSAVADKMFFTKRIADLPLGFEISTPKTRDEPRAPIRVTFTGDDGFTLEKQPATLTPSAQKLLEWAKGHGVDATFTKVDIVQGSGLSTRTVVAATGELMFNRLFEDAGKQVRARLFRLASWAKPNAKRDATATQTTFEEQGGR